jgi:type IV pilus assembly protein PilC
MPVFVYEAKDRNGQTVRSEIEANNKDDAEKAIRARGLRPGAVRLKPGGASKKKEAKAKKKAFILFDKVTAEQVTTFTIQLSILQDAGLPIVRSLRVLEGQQKPGKFKDQVSGVAEDVEGGSTFSEALAKYPRSFDRLYVSMVKAGEAGGVLDVILQRLAFFMEKSQKLTKRVKGAMVYPLVVITVAVLILVVIMLKVVPAFQKMFSEQGEDLPLPTKILITISDGIKSWWWTAPLVFFLVWSAMKWIARTAPGRKALDRFKLTMPIFGNIIKKSSIARFCRTLGTLITSGVPILEALRIVKDAVGNEVIAEAIESVHGSIREGDTIADPLRQSGIFDDLLVNMIDVGEETGELDKMLMKISDNYDNDVDVAVESMSSLLEPLLIVGMGLMVGFIVVALFMPLVGIIQQVGNQG